MRPTIFVRCDGSRALGLGHVVRCLALADELRARADVTFLMREGSSFAEERGFRVVSPPSVADAHGWIADAVRGADALVLDVRDDLPVSVLRELRRDGTLVVTLDDPSPRRLEADLAFYPPVPQVERLRPADARGWHIGWQWVILRRQFANLPRKTLRAPGHVLVSLGGSDAAGMTARVVRELDRAPREFHMTVVTGGAAVADQKLDDAIRAARHHVYRRENVVEMAPLMQDADVAIATFGVTAYELAAAGTPALYLCHTPDHAESARLFVDAEIGESLGLTAELDDDRLSDRMNVRLNALLGDVERIHAMSARAQELVDGGGAARVADAILAALSTRRFDRSAVVEETRRGGT